jgi:hypothetical protein
MSGKEILQYSQIARILLGLYPEPVTGVQMTRNEWDSALAGALPSFLGGCLLFLLLLLGGFVSDRALELIAFFYCSLPDASTWNPA